MQREPLPGKGWRLLLRPLEPFQGQAETLCGHMWWGGGGGGGGCCLTDVWRGPACLSCQPRRCLLDPSALHSPLSRTFSRVIKRCFSAGLIFTSQTYSAFAWLQTSVHASESLFSERVGQGTQRLFSPVNVLAKKNL